MVTLVTPPSGSFMSLHKFLHDFREFRVFLHDFLGSAFLFLLRGRDYRDLRDGTAGAL